MRRWTAQQPSNMTISRSPDRNSPRLDHRREPPEPIVGALYFIAASRPSVRYEEVDCMNDRPTYPELLKLFYKHSFPDRLGAPASAVAQAIIYKSNDLWFPSEFAMSNKELSHLSGEKLSNIGRTRQKVLDTCTVDGQPLFIYVNGRQRKAGIYKINFNLTSTKLQNPPEIDNDLNITIESDSAKWLLKEFQNCVPGIGWRPESDNQRQRFNELCNAPKDKLEKILESARLKGVSSRGLLKWVEGGLANYGKLYGNTNGSSKVYRDPHKETIDSLMCMYHDYKDGTQPEGDPIPADSVATRLQMSLDNVNEHANELDCSVEAYEALIKEWEARDDLS